MNKGFYDSLRPASFRGIPFEVDTSEKTYGPRVAVHEFILRDDPSQEFLGKLPQNFTVEAVLIGDDVAAQASRLSAALNEESAGRLVHPLYGEFDAVVVGEVRERFSTSEARVIRLVIPFQRAGTQPSPVATTDTASAVTASSDLALSAVASDFARTFSTSGAGFVGDAAQSLIRSLSAETLGSMRAGGLTGLISSGGIGSGLDGLVAILPTELTDALALGQRLLNVFRGPSKPSGLPVSETLLAMAEPTGIGSTLPTPATGTPSRLQVAGNQRAVITAMRAGAAIEAARSGAVEGWASKNDAISWRDRTNTALDLLADASAEAGGDESWRAITDLRVAVTRDVATRAAPLPRLAVLRPLRTTSSSLLAYQMDGDDLAGVFTRAADISHRNRVKHPGFVSGGVELEVLVDD